VFEESASYLAAIQADFVREMLTAEAGMITKKHAEKMRALARNTVVAFIQAFSAELQTQFGEFEVDSPVLDLPEPEDTPEMADEKHRRRAIRVIFNLLTELTSISQSKYTYRTMYFSDGDMNSEELFTLDFVRAMRNRWRAIADVLRELRSTPVDVLVDLPDLERRCLAGDPFGICVAARAVRKTTDRSALTRVLAAQLNADEVAAGRVLERVNELSTTIFESDTACTAESIELSRLVLRALAHDEIADA
jgi:hypothetical protein